MMYSGKDLEFFLVDGFNLIGVTQSIGEEIEDLFADSKPFGERYNESVPTGDKMATLSQSALLDDAELSVIDALSEQGDVKRVVALGFEGNTIGKTYRGYAGAYGSKRSEKAARVAIDDIDVQYAIRGNVERVTILQDIETLAGDGNTTAESVDLLTDTRVPAIAIATSSVANPTHVITSKPHDLITGDKVVIAGHAGSTPSINGPQTVTRISDTEFTIAVNVTVAGNGGTVKKVWSKNGGFAYLHLIELDLSGRPNVVFKVRHSADNITFVDLGTFTAKTAIGAQRLAIAAGTTVNRYLAVSRAYGGAAGTPNCKALVGFVRA